MLSSLVQLALKPLVDPVVLAGRPSTTLCHFCRGITAQALISEHGYKHVEKLGDLRETNLKCSLCLIIFEYFLDHGKLEAQSQLRLKLRLEMPTKMGDGVGVMAICKSPLEKKVFVIDCLYVLIPIGDPATGLGIPLANRYLSNTRSAETFKFIGSCVAECAARHKCMRPVVDRSEVSTLTSWGRTEPPESKWPARLIDVHAFRANETSKKDSVRLVEVRGSCPKYTTLSHRWDRTLTDEHKTTLRTIDLHRARIPLDELTLKFRDAVEITRRMGISYLWIDALCIIQDSDEDWNAESLKMGGIYENSFLTIAANQEGDGGCFNKQSMPHDYLHTERKDMQSVEITNTQPDGRESTVLFHYEKRRRDPLPLRSSILKNRGWIYQERILSPRTVHFTQTQAVWECREMYKLEDLLPSPTAVFDLTFSALILKDSTRVRDVVDHWHRGIVCGDYSRRDFTAPEDRLIALAGVAKIWQYYINDTYLAGIWQSHLAFGLAWMRDEHRKLAPTAENCRRPTWTWASHNGFVAWWPNHSSFQPEARLALRKTELRYCGNKPETFSKVDGGFITIEGVISQVVVQSIPEKAAVSAKMEQFPVKFFVDSLYPKDYASSPVRFPALALGHGVDTTHWIRTYLLVLKPISSTQLSYRRVGFAYVDFQTLEQRTKFWAGITPQVIHLF